MAMNAARPMDRLPTQRRSLRPRQIASALRSKPKRPIANEPRRKLRSKPIASEPQPSLKPRAANARRRKLRRKPIASVRQLSPKSRTANGRRRKLRPKPIASEPQPSLKPRTANAPRRRLRPKPPIAGGLTVDLRPRQQAPHVLRTKLLRLHERKHRPPNSRPTIGATKGSRATNGKREMNGPDLSTDAAHHAKGPAGDGGPFVGCGDWI
jgi:hypothetical protein